MNDTTTMKVKTMKKWKHHQTSYSTRCAPVVGMMDRRSNNNSNNVYEMTGTIWWDDDDDNDNIVLY
jgi:hypothetical protein